MSASDIISSHVSASHPEGIATLELYPLRFRASSSASAKRVRPWTANLLRGAFGSELRRLDRDAYTRFFTPTAESFPSLALRKQSPSGLRDLPRPFVFRLRESEIGINLFLTSAVDLVCKIMAELDLKLAKQPELLELSLSAQDRPQTSRRNQRLRVHFLSPTELKNGQEPEFGVLMTRVRDRISTLRALYGSGPLELDYRAFGDRAIAVRMTVCAVHAVTEERLSKGTGQRHSIGGFTGFAEYEGAVAEFIPYLEAARWTGVGRQTVWGKGEIAVEIIHD